MTPTQFNPTIKIHNSEGLIRKVTTRKQAEELAAIYAKRGIQTFFIHSPYANNNITIK
jgi:hypothetical protein